MALNKGMIAMKNRGKNGVKRSISPITSILAMAMTVGSVLHVVIRCWAWIGSNILPHLGLSTNSVQKGQEADEISVRHSD